MNASIQLVGDGLDKNLQSFLPLEFNCEQTLITKNILTSIETVNNGFVFFFIHEMYENNSPF